MLLKPLFPVIIFYKGVTKIKQQYTLTEPKNKKIRP
jgi:hypothetical protein